MVLLDHRSTRLSLRNAADALGIHRSAIYRIRKEVSGVADPPPRRVPPPPPRRLSEEERAEIIEILHSERFVDQPPREIVATLLSEGRYFCSTRTLYRILAGLGESHERRPQRNHATYEAPFVRATAPNEVWVWDITALPGPAKAQSFFLYAVMDLYSRFVVAWQVAHAQNGDLAERLFLDACIQHDIAPQSLCVHSDRGAPMTSYRLTQMFEQLGVTPSYSRPRVSDDNPHIESQFKTLKYQPEFPRRFHSYGAAVAWCEDYYAWYNEQHHHAGIADFTPANVFFGHVRTIHAIRQSALDRAFAEHPERFVHGPPTAALPPPFVEINPADFLPPESAATAPPSKLVSVRLPNGKGRQLQPQLMLSINS